MNENEPDSSILDTTKGVVLIFALGALLVAIAGCLPFILFGTVSTANEFGDSYGFINAVVSGLALAGVLLTLHLQRKELAEQREQLKRSATAQENSEKAMAVNNYSALVMAVAEIQSTLETLSTNAHKDKKALQKYITVLSYERQLEDVLAAQRDYLRERGYGTIVSNHEAYADVFGPLINLLPMSLDDEMASDFDEPDPDFHFFLTSFVDAADKTDLKKNHNTWIWCWHINRIIESTGDTKIVTLAQRKDLDGYFGKLFEEWHLECFDQSPHEFKSRQPDTGAA